MATRTLKPFQQEHVKAQIQATQLLKRIQNYALGELDLDYGRVQACFKLLEFRIAKAIPDEVSNNLQANTALALQSIQAAQLQLMAQEVLAQMPNTITVDSCTLAEDVTVIATLPASVETSAVDSSTSERST